MEIMPPEVLHRERFVDINPMLCDMWALGVILYFALTGERPFAAARATDRNYALIVVQHSLHEDPNVLRLSDEVKAVLQGLFREVPEDRLTIQEIRQHPWMRLEHA
jgi:serine/threonine protein kinase